MPLLTRKKQLAAVKQTGSALASGLTSASNATAIVLDAAAALEIERIERNLLRDSITAVKDLTGLQAGSITFGVEMKGTQAGSHASGAPSWGIFLQACGFRQVEVSFASIGAITSGPFRHGELVTQTGTAATARVVMDAHSGVATLYLETATISGSPNSSGVWTGQDSGATATPTTAPAAEGFGWYPITDPIKTITFNGTGLTAAVAVGDLIAGITSGARGIVSRVTGTGVDAVVYFRPVRGSFTNGEVVQRITPNADADIGTLAAANAEAFFDWPPLSMRLYEDGTATTLAGCRGNVVFNFEVNRPVRMDFSFRGVVNSTADVPMLGGVAYDNATPPVWETSTIGFSRSDDNAYAATASEVSPCITTLNVDMGVQIVDRKCAGATSGLLEVYGSQRNATGSMNPEATLEADIAWLGRVSDGEVCRLKTTVGSVDGNRFTVAMPGIQFTGVSTGDRDSILVRDMQFRLTGGDLYDLVASPTTLSSIGGNNELVFIYHTS